MRPLLSLLFLCCAYVVSTAQTIDARSLELMKQIARNCAEITPLKFPRPETRIDREVQDFVDRARWVKRDLTELQSASPGAIDSTILIRGAPFNAQVKAALSIIQKNQTALNADSFEKPNEKALAQVDFAIAIARRAAKETEGFDGLSLAYAAYSESLSAAKSIDVRALASRRAELAEAEQTFVAKYIGAKEAHEKQAAVAGEKKREAKTAAAKRVQEMEAKRNAEVKALGYKSSDDGIVNVIEQLRDGSLSLLEAKSFLIYHDPEDDFRVQNTVGSYVIYSCLHRRELFQIAVLREKSGFYGEGAELTGTSYAITGTTSFKTVLGAGKEIVTLKKVQ